mmetsp:Transcript_8266/g.15336  ORF Transcript_8266/g.15336 Transcript_8266/m.15336 type:complete len:566 (-) Transcript_8266:121-1818(-)|eukprot:CAMPEP_0197532812 /NCGR_PEP_ID=MMETSP1318-20131121/41028_1 /TAXON_ID=552666 /ORGANISM="Partenskyella glossopodia, Strain RCC365" /LENGTH=565 /DNA_ID=CAMNT_0043089471 /DNA_START=51 /DNA_END=1748 /DNA_ORIENTATION=+
MGAEVSLSNDLEHKIKVKVINQETGDTLEKCCFEIEAGSSKPLGDTGVEVGKKYEATVTVEPRDATERKGESKADSAEHAVSVSGKEDSGNGSFSLGFEGLAIAKGKTLKVSDIQKKGLVLQWLGSEPTLMSTGLDVKNNSSSGWDSLEVSGHEDSLEVSGNEGIMAAVEPYEALPDMQKTDKQKHIDMKSRVHEDIGDIAAAMNRSTILDKKKIKKKTRDFRRENKWIEMRRYLEKHQKWPSERQLKERIRKGIPPSLRGYVWLRLLGADQKIAENKGKYLELSLIPQPEDSVEPFRTINRDVPRTFPENQYLHGDCSTSGGVSAPERLREILYAYAHYDKNVQYCQGMNLVAAFLMLSCPFQNEEVFWMLERLCHKPAFSLKILYGPNLELAFEFEYVLKKLVKMFLPKLYRAFKKGDKLLGDTFLPFGSVNVFAPKWVISLWSIVPANCAVRIWDVFFNEGHKVLYRVALYVLKCTQKSVLEAATPEGIEGGEYMLALGTLKKSSFIHSLDIWDDEDVMIQKMFKFTNGLRNGQIASLRKKFRKAKKKEQLEMEIKENKKGT